MKARDVIKALIQGILVSLVFGALVILLALGTLYYFIFYAPYHGEKFDPFVWEQKANGERCPMYTDLTKNHLHAGMEKTAVLKLLGKPVNYDNGLRLYNHANTISYFIGMCGSWDINTIDILFDDQDRVMAVKHYQN